MKDEYKCQECANLNTPVCYDCTQITSPSGERRKPKHYCLADGIVSNNAKAGALAAKLTLRLVAGQAVPLSWVMAYNKLISEKE